VTSLLLVALGSAVAAPSSGDCRRIDATLHGGVAFHERATGTGPAISGAMAIGAGLSLHDCTDLPLRIELLLGTDLFGPPWGDGVDAVEVSRLTLDLFAAAGPSVVLLRYNGNTIGVEGLVAPGLRLTRVGTRVWSDSRATYDLGLRAHAIGGAFSTFGPWRFALRGCAGLPWDGVVQLLLVAGYGW
jgi:hypothetical protein